MQTHMTKGSAWAVTEAALARLGIQLRQAASQLCESRGRQQLQLPSVNSVCHHVTYRRI